MSRERRRSDEQLSDLDWLVRARNDIQSLMLRLLQRWDHIEYWQRPVAVSAAFSLWRAVFLLTEREHDDPSELVEKMARRFLIKVIRTNMIAFTDDLSQREWSSGYYVENAIYRVRELGGSAIPPFHGSPPATVRESWQAAFESLSAFVAGTLSGTQGAGSQDDAPDPSP